MIDAEPYLRVQATYRGRLGVEVGVFVAVDHLRRAGVLSDTEHEAYLEIDEWFLENLPNPDFYADGNSIGAVTWFKTPVPEQMRVRVEAMCAILRTHGVAFDVVSSVDPGDVVYEDRFQVGVIPHSRGEPTPMPEGVVLAPTSAGLKRALAWSTVRHVHFDTDVARVARRGDELSGAIAALRRNGYGVHFGRSEALVGAEPAAILRVAALSADIEAAREAGLVAVQWQAVDGAAALVGLLAEHGVDARPTARGDSHA